MNAHMMSRDKSCGAHIALHCVRTECCQENAMQDKPDRASQQHLRDQVKQKLEQVQHILADLSRGSGHRVLKLHRDAEAADCSTTLTFEVWLASKG